MCRPCMSEHGSAASSPSIQASATPPVLNMHWPRLGHTSSLPHWHWLQQGWVQLDAELSSGS